MTRFALIIGAAALALAAPVAAGHVPQPDSAVGHHHSVKPSTGYWFKTRIKGHPGLWRCYMPLHHHGTTFRCVRVR